MTDYLIDVETDDGEPYQARIVGTLIAVDRDVTVYVTDEGVCAAHGAARSRVVTLDDSDDLRDWLGDDAYVAAMNALGRPAILDL